MADPLKKDFFKGTYQNVPDWVSSSNATENVVRDKSGNITSSTAHAEIKGRKFTGRVETDQDKYLKKFINPKDQANYERMKAGGYTGGKPGSVEYARAKADQVSGRKTWDGVYTANKAEEADKANAGNGGSAIDTKSAEQTTKETKEKTEITTPEITPPAGDPVDIDVNVNEKLGDIDDKLNKPTETKTTNRTSLASLPIADKPDYEKANTVKGAGTSSTGRRGNDLKLVNTSLVA